ncbi:MAG: accessory factor UbiK family protein [Pseudomonadales bacterium]
MALSTPSDAPGMLRDRIINQLNEQLSSLFKERGNEEGGELQKSIHLLVQNVFSKLDLVTREEFDAQQEVLQKTRARVAELEADLEQLLDSVQR